MGKQNLSLMDFRETLDRYTGLKKSLAKQPYRRRNICQAREIGSIISGVYWRDSAIGLGEFEHKIESMGIDPDEAKKLRRFADDFTRKELLTILRYAGPGKLTLSHIYAVTTPGGVGIKDLAKAADRGWSSADLKLHSLAKTREFDGYRSRRGGRRGGRKPKVPLDTQVAAEKAKGLSRKLSGYLLEWSRRLNDGGKMHKKVLVILEAASEVEVDLESMLQGE